MLLQIAINATYQLSNEDINYFSKCLFPLAWWHSNNDWLLAFASEHEFNQINYLASIEENLEKIFYLCKGSAQFEYYLATLMFYSKRVSKQSVQDWILILKMRTRLRCEKSGEVRPFGRKCNKNQFQIGLKVLSCPAFFAEQIAQSSFFPWSEGGAQPSIRAFNQIRTYSCTLRYAPNVQYYLFKWSSYWLHKISKPFR